MEKNDKSSPLLAGLVGGLIASAATLSVVYLANKNNREKLAFKLDQLRKSVDEKTLESRSGVSTQLRTLAKKIEASEEKGKTKKK